MAFKDELRDAALKKFTEAPALKKEQPCRLRAGGRFVELISGKSLWKTPGHAKAALVNHLEEVVCSSEALRKGRYATGGYKVPKELAHEMLADGTVEVVPL